MTAGGRAWAPVPEHVLDALLEKWEVPDPTETHEVAYAVRC